MDIRVLRYFLAIAREESISGAAQTLHMTQPPLSRAISELEEEIGKQLFIRGNRKITLTEDGLLLRKRATEIIELVEKTENELSSNDDEQIKGDIYIGGGETQAMRIIAKIAKNLHEEYPKINIHLYSGNANDISERLEKGLLDFGVVIEPANVEKYNHVSLPFKDTWGLLMRKDSPLAELDVITAKDLENIPLLVSRQTTVKSTLSAWSKFDLEKLDIVGSYNLIYNASFLVEENFGYALTLDKLVNTGCNSIFTFKHLSPKLQSDVSIVWKKYQVFSKASEKFLLVLQEAIENNEIQKLI